MKIFTNNGNYFEVDLEDYYLLMGYCWRESKNDICGISEENKRVTVRPHRLIAEILGLTGTITFKDNNFRNCRRDNLVLRNKLGYRGVRKIGNKFRAEIRFNNKPYHLGYFNSAEEASDAYKEARKKYYDT